VENKNFDKKRIDEGSMKMFGFLFFIIVIFSTAYGVENLQVVPVVQSAAPEMAGMDVVFPQHKGCVDNPVEIQLRMRGFLLGEKTSTPRANELVNDRLGQYVNVIIDDNIVFTSRGPSIYPLHDDGDYYQEFYKFSVPFDIKEGRHTMRVFMVKSYGECLKTKDGFVAVEFCLKNKKIDCGLNLTKPYVSYNQPSHNIKHKNSGPILLDFYISNCQLSSDGYKVQLYVDNKKIMRLEKWCPYYLYGLSTGKHTIKLVLLDKKDKEIPDKEGCAEGSFLVF